MKKQFTSMAMKLVVLITFLIWVVTLQLLILPASVLVWKDLLLTNEIVSLSNISFSTSIPLHWSIVSLLLNLLSLCLFARSIIVIERGRTMKSQEDTQTKISNFIYQTNLELNTNQTAKLLIPNN